MDSALSVNTHDSSANADFIQIPLDQLVIGSRLQRPILDARVGQQQLLLAAGKQLVPEYIEHLARRGIETVLIHSSDLERLRNRQNEEGRRDRPNRARVRPGSFSSSEPEPTISGQRHGWKITADSYLRDQAPLALLTRLPERMAEFHRLYQGSVAMVRSMLNRLVREREFNADAALSLSEQHLLLIKEDLDEFLHNGVSPIRDDYPSRHALQTAMVATSMAALMGYPRDDLLDLACGCLLHDSGMLMVPQKLLNQASRLSSRDQLEIQKHPMHAMNLIQQQREISQNVRHIVYQMHERMNGTGYPRGRSGAQIHPLARIAAVADAYLALVSPRPYRAALHPYQAVERILIGGRQGHFDPGAIRALLHSISLFPLGCHVRLSNGQIAIVVRSNRENFARPKVEIVELLETRSARVIDLMEETHLSVVATASAPNTPPDSPVMDPTRILAAASSL